jgi:hypothetical protein
MAALEPERRKQPVGRRENDSWTVWEKHIRDIFIFGVGIGGVVNQLFIVKDPSELLLLASMAMIGVPLVLSADEKRNRGEEK